MDRFLASALFFWQLPHYGVVPSGSEMKGAGCNPVQLKPFFQSYSKILAVEMQLCLLSKAYEFIFCSKENIWILCYWTPLLDF